MHNLYKFKLVSNAYWIPNGWRANVLGKMVNNSSFSLDVHIDQIQYSIQIQILKKHTCYFSSVLFFWFTKSPKALTCCVFLFNSKSAVFLYSKSKILKICIFCTRAFIPNLVYVALIALELYLKWQLSKWIYLNFWKWDDMSIQNG